ncbi:MAG: UDP-N-acetylmuramoyl-L-alanine--D-glutamate ligase, partial [Gemmobacter sp.]
DDSPEARAKAEAEGWQPQDLRLDKVLSGLACLVTSPGIPHLYPRPHPAIARAMALGIPVDNDIGLFFRSLGQADWAALD